ncbi:dephospho-CoA kinase [Solimicrobium silvestre]|uniref:Dephospho-CoA kinase n=1 Tax=Solimicrobium silvestre TaxID=2099400 RepID=A0A2S9GUL7_9BURK|nr:dephospho-CoA kinase [Solimicrobium silvestre]PRC91398.1 dephospho-CoA kinase [Solimicrobium silvestre]
MSSAVDQQKTTNIATGKFLIGLTGGIGSGKTSVANGFAERGASVIDTDAIAHSLTAPGGTAITAIQAAFGNDIISPQGAMDRAKMRALVFSDVRQKLRLEAILHPMIRAEVARQTKLATGPYIIYVVPLLVEKGHWKLARILVVDCDEELQMQRVMQRDGLSEQVVKAIMAQQATRTQRLAVATDVIQNQGAFEALIPEIDRLHQLYCQLSSANQTEYL